MHFAVTKGVVSHRTVGHVQAVDGVSLDIISGETLGPSVGESGSGKTTLVRAEIVGLYWPTGGSIWFEGTDLATLTGRAGKRTRAQLQMVFHALFASLDPRCTIATSIEEPLRINRAGSRGERKERVLELLDVVGISRRMSDPYPQRTVGRPATAGRSGARARAPTVGRRRGRSRQRSETLRSRLGYQSISSSACRSSSG